jgi:transcription elongation factor GreA
MADRIERAREHGDLKENAEYHAAKEEKAKMEARIAQLFGILEDAQIVEIGGATDEVRIGTIVTLRYDGDDEDEVEKYLVGSIEEASEGVTVISPTSALGEALMGAKAGDSVTYEAPNGALTVIVVELH